jgi:CRP/FNR family cyclic AMP-dependent transcriptional regulator
MDPRNLKRFREVLGGGRWFSGLPDGLQEALLAQGMTKKLGKGEWLFARGDAPSGLYAVVDGAIRVAATAPSGKEVLLAVVEAPMWFGEISVLDGQPRTHDAVADEESTLLHVPQAAVDALLDAEPRYWRHLGVLVAGKLRISFGVIEDIVMLPIAVRLARRLVLAAERYGEWQDRSSRVVDLRQEQLATMLSTSRQTVNQLLKDLEARGLVRLSYGNVEILDLDGLRAAATA